MSYHKVSEGERERESEREREIEKERMTDRESETSRRKKKIMLNPKNHLLQHPPLPFKSD